MTAVLLRLSKHESIEHVGEAAEFEKLMVGEIF